MEYKIDDIIAFNIQLFDGNGDPAEPTGTPAYAFYKSNQAMAITGSLTQIDDLTGFYGASITLSAANGFEVNKTYTIRMTAVVDGITVVKVGAFTMTEIETKIDAIASNISAQVGDGVLYEYGPVRDNAGNLLSDVFVTVRISGGDENITTGYTDTSGMVSFWLASGTYDFYSRKNGYSFPNPDTEVVS